MYATYRYFTKFIGKHLLKTCNFIKKEALAQVFSCKFCEISKNIIFTEHLWTTASYSEQFKSNSNRSEKLSKIKIIEKCPKKK